jgi:DNA-binding SARP family transcriptional activator
VDAIVDELWPEAPPASAVPNARGYAGNLRRLIDALEPDEARIIRQGDGYTLSGFEGVLDLVAFQADAEAGHHAFLRSDLPEAAACYANALGRWRGDMLAGEARGRGLTGRCVAVEEERLLVVERLAETSLSLGQPDQALPLLRRLVQGDPLRERAWVLLVRGRYRAGDVAGALSAYRAARETLATELGIEPGAELQNLHREILSRVESSSAAYATRAGSGDSAPPRELPPGIGQFVGREHELGVALDTIAHPNSSTRSRPAVVVFHGPGGTGESTVAVHVAHHVGHLYPDGHLYVDLLGSTPGLRPLALMDAVRRLLLGLGLNEVDVKGVVLLTRLTPDVELDPGVAERVAELCDCIPLALLLAAARLVGRPDETPKEFVVLRIAGSVWTSWRSTGWRFAPASE